MLQVEFDYDEFAKVILEERNLRDLSLRNLADDIGMNYININRIENRLTKPSLDTILMFVNYFGLNYDMFFKEIWR